MFSRSTLYSYVFTLGLVLTANAIIEPSTPGPGTIFKEGGDCRVSWAGDKESPSSWGNMNIQLMSGDNFNMIHITTVATNQDGTTNGAFQFTCPDVEPNSAIYFFQLSSPASETKAWTTRFTIAAADGTVVPPENDTQPGTGDEIPWGVGALSDPDSATPPPEIGTEVGGGSSGTSGSPSGTESESSGPSATPSLPGSAIGPGDAGNDGVDAGAGAGAGANTPPQNNGPTGTRNNGGPTGASNSTNDASAASTTYGESSVWKLTILGFSLLLSGNML